MIKMKASVGGLGKLLDKLREQQKSFKGTSGRASAIVGYDKDGTVPYAISVHEIIGPYHEPPTQAKFLTDPLRMKAGEIRGTIVTALHQGMSLEDAVVVGGFYLLQESRKIVPYDTGALYNSGFVRPE